MSETLDDFLNGTAGGEAVSAPEEAAQPVTTEERSQPEGQAAPQPEAPAEGEAAPERSDGRTVPLAALEGERKARQDWKDRAARAETERDALNKQLEELRRAPQAAPPAPPQPIDPVHQPEAFVERIQQVVLNERLNSSEMLLRREIGAEAVDAAIADFKQAAAEDPRLFQQLYSQPDPYGWLAKQVEGIRLRREIGDDPAAYRAKLRAELEAEMGRAEPAGPGAPRMAPSLANVRSAAPRSAPVFTGPTPIEDVLRRG